MAWILVGIFVYAGCSGTRSLDRGGGERRSRDARPHPRRLRLARQLVVGALALLYLFIPIFIVILFSFNDNKGRFNFTWHGFTLDHWEHPFAEPGPCDGAEELAADRVDLDA